MNTSSVVFLLKKKAMAVEWRLLIFLLLFMNVKLGCKLAALCLVFLLQPNIKFGLRLANSRLPLFYILVALIAVLNFIIVQDFSTPYIFVTATGIAFWLACFAALHQVKLFTEQTSNEVLHNTLRLFFILNILCSGINLLQILLDIGPRNPFLYQGHYQQYFINTGDYIKGLTFDTSTTNALINCFGILYFLYRKHYLLTLACMITLLLAASNFSNAMLLLLFLGLFIFNSNREQKSVMVICTCLLIIFFGKISPQNEYYVNDTLAKFLWHTNRSTVMPDKIIPIRERPDSLLTEDTRKEKIATLYLDSLERTRVSAAGYLLSLNTGTIHKPGLPQDSIHTASFQWKRDTTQFQRTLASYVTERSGYQPSSYSKKIPGKILAIQQSVYYLQQHPMQLITGTGAGNFSSKLAFRATGLQVAGSFPKKMEYCNRAFLHNHLSLYAWFLTQHADAHSIIHNPASVYDQLLTEYGLLGLLALPVYYIGFFAKQYKKLSYGMPLLLLLLAFFTVEYWFEQLSVVVLFELLLFINLKENTQAPANA